MNLKLHSPKKIKKPLSKVLKGSPKKLGDRFKKSPAKIRKL
jgi:hypothetical protein